MNFYCIIIALIAFFIAIITFFYDFTDHIFIGMLRMEDTIENSREKEEIFRSRPTNNKPARKNNLRTQQIQNQPIVVQEPPRSSTIQENSKPLDIVSQTFSNFPAFQKNTDDSDFR